jgi:CheY-like chemotaxis protein
MVTRLAMDLAKLHKFDLVISDIGLPDGEGYDLMKHLQLNYGLRGTLRYHIICDILGICLSGCGSEEDIERGKQSGFEIHMLKPVQIQALESAIANFELQQKLVSMRL